MKIKASLLLEAYGVLADIVKRPRAIGTKGKYRIARAVALIEPEAIVLEKTRIELIKKHGEEVFKGDGAAKTSDGWQVPKEKMPEYIKEWNEVAAGEIEVNVEPIPLSQLEFVEPKYTDPEKPAPCGIESHEFILLGPLVVDDAPVAKAA